jgi:hypothetical protein
MESNVEKLKIELENKEKLIDELEIFEMNCHTLEDKNCDLKKKCKLHGKQLAEMKTVIIFRIIFFHSMISVVFVPKFLFSTSSILCCNNLLPCEIQ